MKHISEWMPYGQAVKSHNVAMELRWISVLQHDMATGLFRCLYVAKLAA